MFKSSSDRLSYLNRTGSHATKPHPTGLIEDIPQWAAEPEAYYKSVRDQYRSLNEQMARTQASLVEVNEKLRTTLPHKEYEHSRQHKEQLAARYLILQEQTSSFRELARAAGDHAWATVFYLIARRLLRHDDFVAILKETEQLLDRREHEVKHGAAGRSEEARRNRYNRVNKQKRRAHFREKYDAGGRPVIRDGKRYWAYPRDSDYPKQEDK